MAFVSIPKDLTKIEPKIAFSFTKRQLLFLIPGAVAGIFFFIKTRGVFGNSTSMVLMMCIMAPFFMFAMYKQRKTGLRLEKVLQNFLRARLARPLVRPVTPDAEAKPGILSKLARAIVREQIVPTTAADSIPFDMLYRDGITRIGNTYSKTVAFNDINYHLAESKEQASLFSLYCVFLNHFDNAVSFQITAQSTRVNPRDFDNLIPFPKKDDGFNHVRREYARVLRDQRMKGTNALRRQKFLTFSVEADNYKKAKLKLERTESAIKQTLKPLGVYITELSAMKRLEVIYDSLHPDGRVKFSAQAALADKKAMSKNYIVPTGGFDFSDKDRFRMGKRYATAIMMMLDTAELPDDMLSEMISGEHPVTLTLCANSMEQRNAIKSAKNTLTDLMKTSIEIEQKAYQNGHMAALPPDLKSNIEEVEGIVKGLQERNERMFNVTIVALCSGATEQELEDSISTLEAVAKGQSCEWIRLDNLQECGMQTSLPMGVNRLGLTRALPTSGAAVFIPFTTPELFRLPGMYYGLNALSKNLIMADRSTLKNPNGLFLGTPGSGKSFAAKREAVNVFLTTDSDIIICDPEGEYSPLVKHLGGQVLKLSPSGQYYVNPLDINVNYASGGDEGETQDPIALKSDFIVSLCELVLGKSDNDWSRIVAVVDRSVRKLYTQYFLDPKPEKMPILTDLWELIRADGDNDDFARTIALSLEPYVTGSRNFFNHRTNIDVSNRLVCFDIRDLGDGLKKLGMLTLQDHVWGRVSRNRNENRKTWYYIDEMHLLLKDKQTAAYTVEIWKRFRKWGGVPTGITQNVTDLLQSQEVENIFGNSDFVMMLNQTDSDRDVLAKKLSISKQQLSYVTRSGEGEGLLSFDGNIVPFRDNFPKDTELYKLLTTKPNE